MTLSALASGATRDAAAFADSRVREPRDCEQSSLMLSKNTEELTVTAIAARHHVTPRYIHKLFEGGGITYSEFVLDQRLARAHRMLTDPRLTDRTIGSLAYDVGFGDLSYFNRAFRRRYHATPSEVRSRFANRCLITLPVCTKGR